MLGETRDLTATEQYALRQFCFSFPIWKVQKYFNLIMKAIVTFLLLQYENIIINTKYLYFDDRVFCKVLVKLAHLNAPQTLQM